MSARSVLLSILASTLLLSSAALSSTTALGREPQVAVALPKFQVTLNGVPVHSEYETYPLLVYKGITYFPMTFHMSRFMGVETNWAPEAGLAIEHTGVTASFRTDRVPEKNNTSQRAVLAAGKIAVNGTAIDNAREPYPLLQFRGVTYFPLTWRFAVEQFGWQYAFDAEQGLSIRSHAPPEPVNASYWKPGDVSGHALYHGHLYYVGERDGKRSIFRLPLNAPGEPSEVVVMSEDGEHPPAGFFFKGGSLYFRYRIGGATMGTTVIGQLNAEGQVERYIRGGGLSPIFTIIDERIIVADPFVPPTPGNLTVTGGDGSSVLGDPSLYYGFSGEDIEDANGWIYIAARSGWQDESTNLLYRIHPETNETLPVSDIPVENFRLSRGKLYTLGRNDHVLYVSDLDGTNRRIAVDVPVVGFALGDGALYYITAETRELYAMTDDGQIRALMPGKRVKSIRLQEETLLGLLEEREAYGLVVFDRDLNLVFKTSDKVADAGFEAGRLVYRTLDAETGGGGAFYTVSLKVSAAK